MSEWDSLDFKPRARGMIIGDIPCDEGRIGEYLFP
jgi:hypothetical protein